MAGNLLTAAVLVAEAAELATPPRENCPFLGDRSCVARSAVKCLGNEICALKRTRRHMVRHFDHVEIFLDSQLLLVVGAPHEDGSLR